MTTNQIETLIKKYEDKIRQLHIDQHTDDAMPHTKYVAMIQCYEEFISTLKSVINPS